MNRLLDNWLLLQKYWSNFWSVATLLIPPYSTAVKPDLEGYNAQYQKYEEMTKMPMRILLKFTLQNLRLEGNLVGYDEIKPFDKIRFYATRQSWLRGEDSDLEPYPYRFPLVTKRSGLSHPRFNRGRVYSLYTF